jgi:hypothetical protein
MRKFLHYEIEGESTIGRDTVLLAQDTDLTAGTPWTGQGFSVQPLLSPEEATRLKEGMRQIIFNLVRAQGLSVAEEAPLEDYHHIIENRDEVHYAVAKWGLPLSDLPISPDFLIQRISALMTLPLKVRKIPSSDQLLFGFRVVRPGSTDESPFHRDAWQEFWRSTLNVWIPVAGCNAGSTLTVMPGSHRWSESQVERTMEGARVNGKQYRVPAVVNVFRPFRIVSPNPDYSEALLFSPYLIHGGGSNGNLDQTRVSIEIRLERDLSNC